MRCPPTLASIRSGRKRRWTLSFRHRQSRYRRGEWHRIAQSQRGAERQLQCDPERSPGRAGRSAHGGCLRKKAGREPCSVSGMYIRRCLCLTQEASTTVRRNIRAVGANCQSARRKESSQVCAQHSSVCALATIVSSPKSASRRSVENRSPISSKPVSGQVPVGRQTRSWQRDPITFYDFVVPTIPVHESSVLIYTQFLPAKSVTIDRSALLPRSGLRLTSRRLPSASGTIREWVSKPSG